MDEGYDDVTFQKIADRCGITRTTLYIYFKNKREIFLWSIKELTQNLEQKLLAITSDKTLEAPIALKKISYTIIDSCIENKKLFNVLLAYLMQLQKSGGDSGEKVRRRVIRLRHLLTSKIVEGEKKGQLKISSVKDANELLYSLIESAIFRLSILNQNRLDEVYGAIDIAIAGMSK